MINTLVHRLESCKYTQAFNLGHSSLLLQEAIFQLVLNIRIVRYMELNI